MQPVDDKEPLLRVARAIAPFGAEFVVVGGWAHQLHRFSDLAGPVEFDALRTEDLDIAAPQRVPPQDAPLDHSLALAGFRADQSGDETPPATRYVFEARPSFYIQFIAPRAGSGVRRDGSKVATIVVAGVVAECLRYVDLLRSRPWVVELTSQRGFPGNNAVRVHVVNASCFLAQKLLIRPDRTPEQRMKDIVYVHDTLLMFARSLNELGVLWADVAREQPRGTAKEVADRARSLTASTTDDLREAARLLATLSRPQAPTVVALRSTLEIGLSAIFPVAKSR